MMARTGGKPDDAARSRTRYALRIVLSLGLLVGLFWVVDISEVAGILGAVSVPILLVILALQTLDRLLMTFKWWLLLEAAGLGIGLPTAVRSYYISSFAGLLLPMTLGADVVRTLTLRNRGAVSAVVATIALERGIGAVAHAMLCVVSVVLLVQMGLDPGIPVENLWLLVVALLVVSSLGLPASFMAANRASVWLQTRGGIAGKLASLASSYAAASQRPRVVWTFLLLTVLEGFLPIVVHYLAAMALGFHLPFVLFLAIIPIVYLVGRLPISLGGIGVVEGTFVLFGTLMGIEADAALSIALLSQVTMIVILLPGAAAYLMKSGEGEAPSADSDAGRSEAETS